MNLIYQKQKKKIEVHNYLPREKLLSFLSQMDFLVNITYDPKTQIPSKLIDYYIVNRPILNLKDQNFKGELVEEFLNGNYSNKFQHPNIEQYNIKSVAEKFTALAGIL